MRRFPTAAPALIVLGTVAAMAIAACGSGGGSAEAPPAGAPSGAAPSLTRPATAAPKPITGTAPGRTFEVAQRKLTAQRDGRKIPVTIWYPQGTGPFPVVLFSHGLGAGPADYQPLLARWARAGFLVAAPAYPQTSRDASRINVLDVLNQPADASAALSAVLALNKTSLRGKLATDRVAAAGHSAGGVTTVGLFTVARDPRLRAGMVLAGSALGMGVTYTGSAAPMLFVHGQKDTVVRYADGKAAYDSVPWPKAMLTLPAAGHGEALLDSRDGGFAVVAGTTLDFLRYTLYGDAAAKRRIAGDAKAGGVAKLDNRL